MWYQSHGYAPWAAADRRLLAEDDQECYRIRRGARFDDPSRAHGDFAEKSIRPRPRRQPVVGVFPPEPLFEGSSEGHHRLQSWTTQPRIVRRRRDRPKVHHNHRQSHSTPASLPPQSKNHYHDLQIHPRHYSPPATSSRSYPSNDLDFNNREKNSTPHSLGERRFTTSTHKFRDLTPKVLNSDHRRSSHCSNSPRQDPVAFITDLRSPNPEPCFINHGSAIPSHDLASSDHPSQDFATSITDLQHPSHEMPRSTRGQDSSRRNRALPHHDAVPPLCNFRRTRDDDFAFADGPPNQICSATFSLDSFCSRPDQVSYSEQTRPTSHTRVPEYFSDLQTCSNSRGPVRARIENHHPHQASLACSVGRKCLLPSQAQRWSQSTKASRYHEVSVIDQFDLDISIFTGGLNLDGTLEWIEEVDEFFDFVEVELMNQAKLVASKLRDYAAYWWKRLQYQRVCDGKEKIKSWAKMKIKLQKKFLPNDYEHLLPSDYYHNVEYDVVDSSRYKCRDNGALRAIVEKNKQKDVEFLHLPADKAENSGPYVVLDNSKFTESTRGAVLTRGSWNGRMTSTTRVEKETSHSFGQDGVKEHEKQVEELMESVIIEGRHHMDDSVSPGPQNLDAISGDSTVPEGSEIGKEVNQELIMRSFEYSSKKIEHVIELGISNEDCGEKYMQISMEAPSVNHESVEQNASWEVDFGMIELSAVFVKANDHRLLLTGAIIKGSSVNEWCKAKNDLFMSNKNRRHKTFMDFIASCVFILKLLWDFDAIKKEFSIGVYQNHKKKTKTKKKHVG